MRPPATPSCRRRLTSISSRSTHGPHRHATDFVENSEGSPGVGHRQNRPVKYPRAEPRRCSARCASRRTACTLAGARGLRGGRADSFDGSRSPTRTAYLLAARQVTPGRFTCIKSG
jgi:hypothetical protein